MRRTYDVVADSYADHYRTTDPEQPVDIAMITHFLGLVGAGRMLPRLAASGCVVEGVDLSEAMVRRARADHGTFATQVASLRDLPHEDGSFDGVFSWYSTIHSDDQDVAVILRELARVLRPAGHLLIAFQTGAGVRDVGRRFGQSGTMCVCCATTGLRRRSEPPCSEPASQWLPPSTGRLSAPSRTARPSSSRAARQALPTQRRT